MFILPDAGDGLAAAAGPPDGGQPHLHRCRPGQPEVTHSALHCTALYWQSRSPLPPAARLHRSPPVLPRGRGGLRHLHRYRRHSLPLFPQGGSFLLFFGLNLDGVVGRIVLVIIQSFGLGYLYVRAVHCAAQDIETNDGGWRRPYSMSKRLMKIMEYENV